MLWCAKTTLAPHVTLWKAEPGDEKMSDSDNERRAEAERLAELPRDVQRKAIALIRAPANDPKVRKCDREEARERADALTRNLRRMNRKTHRKKS
jgi:hypothetical protein